jgi:hypothetical protein
MPWDWMGIDPQRHPVQDVHERDDHPKPGLPGADDPAQPEQNTQLVLLDDPHRQHRPQHQDSGSDQADDDEDVHDASPSAREIEASSLRLVGFFIMALRDWFAAVSKVLEFRPCQSATDPWRVTKWHHPRAKGRKALLRPGTDGPVSNR